MMVPSKNRYFQETFNIPHADIECLEKEKIKKIEKAMELVLKKYPLMEHLWCGIGSKKFINEQVNIARAYYPQGYSLIDDAINKSDAVYVDAYNELRLNAVLVDLPTGGTIYLGIMYNDVFKNKQVYEIEFGCHKQMMVGFLPRGSITIESLFVHELAHILDKVVEFSDSFTFERTVAECKARGFDIARDISKNALKSKKELFADAFTEYMMNPNASEHAIIIMNEFNSYYSDFVLAGAIDHVNAPYQANSQIDNEKGVLK